MAKITADYTYTDAELLAIVREAIAVVTKFNQSYTIRGREYNRADLRALQDWEADLARRISAATNGLAQNFVRLKRPSG